METKKKISILFYILILVILILGINVVYAENNIGIGTEIEMTYSKLQSRNDILCIQHGQSLKGEITYRVTDIVNIGTGYGTSNILEARIENGTASKEDRLNAKMAYLAYEAVKPNSEYNESYPSTLQKLIWNESNGYSNWYKNVGRELLQNEYSPGSSTGMTDKMKELNAKASTYADFAEKYVEFLRENGNVGIKRTSQTQLETQNYNNKAYIGPFTYDFVQVETNYDNIPLTYGNLRSIRIDNTLIQTVLVKDGNTYREINVSEIQPNQSFYVEKIENLNDDSRITITQNAQTYHARIFFLSAGSWQKLIMVKGKVEGISVTEEIGKIADFDLALRKYISSINGETITTRYPNAVTDRLINGTETTAEYHHTKQPMLVSKGDRVIYSIRIYNEGKIDGYATKITDYLPEGLEFVEGSLLNQAMGWTAQKNADGTTTVTTTHLSGRLLTAFDLAENNLIENSVAIQIECVVSDTAEANAILTNIAEITEAKDINGNTFDRDSTPGTINGAVDGSYKDNEISSGATYIPGQEDDDDFEKIKIRPEVDITGIVWIDEPRDKNMEKNGLMDDGEELVDGVKVTLYEGNTVIATTTTVNGEYKFEKVPAGRDYRIEIEYNGMKYTTTYYLVAGENNSKGEEAETLRREFNTKFREISPSSGIEYQKEDALDDTSFAKATAITDGKDEFKITASTDATYQRDATLQNLSSNAVVNFGLARRTPVDFTLMQGIQKINISINGKIFEDEISVNDVGNTLTEDVIKGYLAERNQIREYYIKRSDYTYRIGNYKDLSEMVDQDLDLSKELNIVVTYAIVIYNQNTVQGTVSELVNYYSDSYELLLVTDSPNSNESKFETQVLPTSYAGYNAVTIDTSRLGNIEGAHAKAIYVKYQVKKDNETDRNILLGNKQVVSEINIYSGYTENATWDYEKYYNGTIDQDSAPGNADPTASIRTFEDDTAKAPGLELKLDDTPRTISGIVWDDSNTDGIRDDAETKVNGVTVQFIETKETNGETQEFIWKEMQTGINKVSYVGFAGGINRDIDTSKSMQSGEYYLEDFIPGDYIIRFRYGDDVQTIKIELNNGTSYNGHDYQATTVNAGNDDTIDSDATDNAERREQVKEYAKLVNNNKGNILASPYANPVDEVKLQELVDNTYMNADTDKFEVTIETENISNVDLGLSKTIENRIILEKQVSHITVTLNNGTQFIDTDIPAESNVSGLFVTGDRLWIQMDNEIINGATLEVTYKLIVKNQGEDIVSNIKLIDYLPEGMRVNYALNNGWSAVEADKLDSMIDISFVDKVKQYISTVITNSEIDRLAPGEEKEITLIASTTLSPDKDDYNYTNIAEIVEFTSENGKRNEEGIPGNQDPTTEEYKENDADPSEEVIITKPTGNMRIYYVLGFSILVAIGVGVFAIKKFVVKK